MLRLTVSTEEYLMIGEDIKLVFLGGTGKHLRIMIDAPRDKNIVRSTVLERSITDPEERAKLPKYYAEEEHPEKYVKKDARRAKPEKAGDSMEKAETGETEPAGKALGTLKNPRIIITHGNAGSR
ncbi:MAG: carbon storage regulator [Eubacterium sp.]|nr:carbon storage regulator [Eubacterium sp.]MCM1305001.1 carbon storage regulator [Butyrivibrio sp.]MCM1345036.1 carbon storage regulator [Muribaculaceae bacterium]